MYNYMSWLVSLPVVASLPSSDSHSCNPGNGESDYDTPDDDNPNDDNGDPDNSNPDNGNPDTNDSDNRASDASYSNDS